MTRIVVTAPARRDRNEILTFLNEEAGPAVARKFAARFRDCAERLFRMPVYGAPRPDLGAECRGVVIAPYVLLYNYAEDRDQVTILRILHAKRAITQKLLKR
jgi:plasmid stabilization system protein ParE